MKKVLLAIALMVFTLSMTLPFASAKAAEAVSEPTVEIDELFVEVGAGLYTVDENFNIVKGDKVNYLAEFDANGELVKSGFKLVEVGEQIANKTLYIYNQNATAFFNIILSDGSSISKYTNFGYYENAVFKSATEINGNTHFKLQYTKSADAKVTQAIFTSKAADPEAYAIAYTYYELPEIPEIEEPTIEENDEAETTIGDTIAEWMAKHLGMTVSSTGALIIVGGLLFYFLRGK